MRSIKENVLFQKPELRNFCLYRLIFGVSYSFMIPIIPLYLNSVGISTMMVGAIMSMYGLSKALAQVPFGGVSDKIGDKRLLIIALAIMTSVPMGYVVFNGKIMAGATYIIQGAILGIAAPATFSILARSLDENKRGECTGLASAVFTLGGGIGAEIAGFIESKLNNFNLIFFCATGGILLTTIFVFFKIKKSEVAEKKDKDKEKSKISKDDTKNRIKGMYEEIKKNKLGCKIVLLSAIAFLGDFIFGSITSIFPFYGQDVLGASTFYTSSIISVYLFVFGLGAPFAGWVSDKVGNKKQLLTSFVVMNASLLALGIFRSVMLFTGIIVVYFLGATFLNASLQSVLSEFGENDKIKGIVFGIVGASESVGFAVGPIYSAFVYNMNEQWLFFGVLVISIIVTIVYLLLYKKSCLT